MLDPVSDPGSPGLATAFTRAALDVSVGLIGRTQEVRDARSEPPRPPGSDPDGCRAPKTRSGSTRPVRASDLPHRLPRADELTGGTMGFAGPSVRSATGFEPAAAGATTRSVLLVGAHSPRVRSRPARVQTLSELWRRIVPHRWIETSDPESGRLRSNQRPLACQTRRRSVDPLRAVARRRCGSGERQAGRANTPGPDLASLIPVHGRQNAC
jgi:hypothetical protein